MQARNPRKASWRLLLPVLIATFLIMITDATAQDQSTAKGMAERFPPGTIFALRYKDIEKTLGWLGNSPFSAMIKDPEVKPLWEQGITWVKKFAKQGEERTGVNFLDMLGRIKGEVAIGLTKLKISQPPVPGILITLDCRGESAAFKKDIETLLKLVPEKFYRSATREVMEIPINTYTPVKSDRRRDPAKMIGSVHLAWIDSILVLSNDKSGFDKFIQVSRQEDLKTLGDTDNWKDTMEKLGGAGEMTFYVNIHAISELIEAATGLMPEDVGPVISALGLDEFPAMGSAVFMNKEGVTSRFLLRYTGDRKSGLGSLMQFKKADLSIPRWVPEDAWQVMVFNYDYEAAFSGFLGLVKEAGEEPYEELEEGLEEFHKMFGISLQDDLIGALSNPIVMVRLTPTGKESQVYDPSRRNPVMFDPMGGGGPILFGVRIRNRETIETFLEYFEGMGAELTEYMGATILSGPTFDENQPVVELAITDTHVLFGVGNTPIVRQTLQRIGGQARGLGGVEGVRDSLEGLPREGVGLLVYNYGKMLSTTVNVMKVAMAFSKKADFLAKLKLPSSDVFEKYLGYAAGVMTFEPGIGLIIDSSFKFKCD